MQRTSADVALSVSMSISVKFYQNPSRYLVEKKSRKFTQVVVYWFCCLYFRNFYFDTVFYFALQKKETKAIFFFIYARSCILHQKLSVHKQLSNHWVISFYRLVKLLWSPPIPYISMYKFVLDFLEYGFA